MIERMIKEKKRLYFSIGFLCVSIVFAFYVIKTNKLPYYGSLYERDYAAMEEKYAEQIKEKNEFEQNTKATARKEIAYGMICDEYGKDINIDDLLNKEHVTKTNHDYGEFILDDSIDLNDFHWALSEGKVAVIMDRNIVSDPGALNWHGMHEYQIAVLISDNKQYTIEVTKIE